MIRARYYKENDTHTLTVLGHAGYDEYGKDIVCAGVSAIVQALMGWIENNPYCAECISTDETSGELIIACTGGEDVEAVFSMATIGIGQIAEVYPYHVNIEVSR